MKRLAWFLPMRGCSRRCIYCDQTRITGELSAPSPAEIAHELSRERSPVELCYFGGSFGELPIDTAREYLDALDAAPVGSVVTFSTYPTSLLGEHGRALLDLIAGFPIGTVELGTPSLDDDVLAACGRGGSGEETRRALELLRDAGIHAGAQIMTGLPLQDVESNLRDIEAIASIMPSGAAWHLRIYPCLVLRGTALAAAYEQGRYAPQSLEEAVRAAGRLIVSAKAAGLVPIRVGLHDSPSLRESVVAGPYHPAFGELAAGEALALELASLHPTGPWDVPPKKISLLTGHGRRGMKRLSELAATCVF